MVCQLKKAVALLRFSTQKRTLFGNTLCIRNCPWRFMVVRGGEIYNTYPKRI